MKAIRIIALMLVLLSGCSSQPRSNEKNFIVKSATLTISKHYKVILQPALKEYVVSEVDGIIAAVHEKAGQLIAAQQLLLSIIPDHLIADVTDLLLEAKKALRSLNISNERQKQQKYLFAQGLIARNQLEDFLSEHQEKQLNWQMTYNKLSQLLSSCKNEQLSQNIQKTLAIQELSHLPKLQNFHCYVLNTQQGWIQNKLEFSLNTSMPSKQQAGINIKKGDLVYEIRDYKNLEATITIGAEDEEYFTLGEKLSLLDPQGHAHGEAVVSKIEEYFNKEANNGKAIVVTAKLLSKNEDLTPREYAKGNYQFVVEKRYFKQLLVPVSAVYFEKDSYFVNKKQTDGTVIATAVELGVGNDDWVAIQNGLQVGDCIVIPH